MFDSTAEECKLYLKISCVSSVNVPPRAHAPLVRNCKDCERNLGHEGGNCPGGGGTTYSLLTRAALMSKELSLLFLPPPEENSRPPLFLSFRNLGWKYELRMPSRLGNPFSRVDFHDAFFFADQIALAIYNLYEKVTADRPPPPASVSPGRT